MTDRVYPASRPGVTNLNGAYTKGQAYGAALPRYRPRPAKPRRSRGCLCCLWFLIIVAILIVLVAIAGAVLWLLYRPQEPKFSVGTLQISKLSVTKNTHLASDIQLQLTARNPNKKITFVYDDFNVQISSGDADLVDGSFPGFFHGKKNTTVVNADLKTKDLVLSTSDATKLKSAQSKGKISLDVNLDSHFRAKLGKWKTQKIKIEVKCSKVPGVISKTKKPSATSTADAKCDFNVKFKIFKWYI